MVNRYPLLLALATMPDEAFSWFAVWANGNMVQYPDGLGGFPLDSRESIQRFRREAETYLSHFKEN